MIGIIFKNLLVTIGNIMHLFNRIYENRHAVLLLI